MLGDLYKLLGFLPLIFSDSFSCLQALPSFKYEHPQTLQIIEMIDKLKSQNKVIKLCWVPSHMGIKGNEKADEAAKSALLIPVDKNIKISYTDTRSAITAHFKGIFQTRWNDLQFNKLKSVKEHVGRLFLKMLLLDVMKQSYIEPVSVTLV